jgi:hypothetical protein
MSIEIARKILDQVKDGSNEYSTFVITRGAGHAHNIRTMMTAVRENEYENDITQQPAGGEADAPTVGKNEAST